MKWLKSTTSKSYTALGKIIPASTSAPLAVDEATYKKISDMAVIKSLINNGGILVLDKYTDMSGSTDAQTQRLQMLTAENSKLADRIRELESKQTDAEEAPTKKEVKAAQKAQAEAEAKLAELEAKYAALEKEANEKIAELSSAKTEEEA